MTTSPRFLVRQIEENPVALRKAKTDNKEYVQLRDSIKREGVLMPILLTNLFQADGKSPKLTEDGLVVYRLVDGLQRFTASKELGLQDVPGTVVAADDARVERMQIIANAQRVRTQPAELASHLERIMGRDPTRTMSELGAQLGFSPEWLGKVLSINEIKDQKIKDLINEGKITVSNATDLAKLPEEEQASFVKDAIQDAAVVFGPKVKNRIKELKDAKRAAREPGQQTGFVWEPHLRSKAEAMKELDGLPTLGILLKSAGVSNPTEVAKFTLTWLLRMDTQSIEAGKAAHEARKKEREETNIRAKAERDAQRAKESAAQAAAVGR